MRAGKVILANYGASLGKLRFNAVDFFPDHPDEMEWWSKGGCYRPLRVWGDLVGLGQEFLDMHAAVYNLFTLWVQAIWAAIWSVQSTTGISGKVRLTVGPKQRLEDVDQNFIRS